MGKFCDVQVILLLIFLTLANCEGEEKSGKEILRQPKFGFLSSATNVISSMAQDLLSRSATSSQVLSLNLTNLVILFVLKAIIFGASSFGFGHGGYGRSADYAASENVLEKQLNGLFSEDELLFMLSYLQADSTEKYDCLHRVACEEPSKAEEYLMAGRVFLKGTELIGGTSQNSRYGKILTQLQEAVGYGLTGRNCATKYHCNFKNR